MVRRRPALLLAVLFSAALVFAAANGAWLARVPDNDHRKTNPYERQPDAVAAGRNIFQEHCAKCHGENAEGVKKRPSLRTQRVQQQASVGDLHWLLVNGSMKKGMPSWAKLPDPQLWQLVTYIKSLHQ
ncbi:MAG: c-type cytochrome [Terriglobales bacterium]